MKYAVISLVLASSMLTGCNDDGITPTGQACLGANNDSLVERLNEQCKKGDIIATKHPAYFCDFKSTIVMNNYDSAICIYVGDGVNERLAQPEPEKSKQ